MSALLLDPITGRPEGGAPHLLSPRGLPFVIEDNIANGWLPRNGGILTEKQLENLPSSVIDNLAKAEQHRGYLEPRAAGNGLWQQTVYVIMADGTQIAASTAEALMIPDFTIPASSLIPLSTLRYTLYFDVSNVVTTPGTLTLRFRFGGLAGTILAATSAITMSSTARATFSGSMTVVMTVRSIGASGSIFMQGEAHLNNVPTAADSAPQGIYTMGSAGANIPAVVSSLNTATNQALSATAQFSVNTAGTQLTAHLGILESLFQD